MAVIAIFTIIAALVAIIWAVVKRTKKTDAALRRIEEKIEGGPTK